MSEFTKGKWYLDDDKENVYVIYENEEDGQKRRVYVTAAWVAGGIHDEEVKANARLIAAAPEMYEWLKTIAKTFENGNVINVSGIKALLARIDGKEHEELHEAEAQE